MDKITIDKTRGELFKCQFKVEGASINDAMVRLCLEFDDNKNLFFNGSVAETGECVIEIPKLKEMESKYGKLTVEAIVDSVYFKLYEADVELSQSVDIAMVTPPQTKPVQASIKLEGISTGAVPAQKSQKSRKVNESIKKGLGSYVAWKKSRQLEDDSRERDV